MFMRVIIASALLCSTAAIAAADITAGDLVGTWECKSQNTQATETITGSMTLNENSTTAYDFKMLFQTPNGSAEITGNMYGTFEVSGDVLATTTTAMEIGDVTGTGAVGLALQEPNFYQDFVNRIKNAALQSPTGEDDIVSFSETKLVTTNKGNGYTQTCTR